jgi:NAD(P)-dependent dehydrogenase (short-subunit alcohol dehydrogenase family)
MNKLNNKTVIITGSTSGIGEGIAKRFAKEGANIIISGRNQQAGERVCREIRDMDRGSCYFVEGDITEFATNELLVSTALHQFGNLDIIILSAGKLGIGATADITVETWEETIATNLNAVFYLCYLSLPHMRKQGSGNIIVISSIAAYKFFPNHPAYCASKAGVTAFIRQLALDYGPQIRANLICPGQVDTPLLQNSTQAFDDPENIIRQTAERIPMKRIGKPDDIAGTALFLASDEATWITGSSFVVDGGSLLL